MGLVFAVFVYFCLDLIVLLISLLYAFGLGCFVLFADLRMVVCL